MYIWVTMGKQEWENLFSKDATLGSGMFDAKSTIEEGV